MPFTTMAGMLGGNVRVGLEDSLWIGPGQLAKSNAEQVRAARQVIERLRPRFLLVPLQVESPTAITLLAAIITLTPGTVSSNVSGDRRTLLVHALSETDPEAAVALIKARYERPILEIFGC